VGLPLLAAEAEVEHNFPEQVELVKVPPLMLHKVVGLAAEVDFLY
jgi:hypothetical protein